jgi:predicted nuclease with TOPRIM domain
MYKFVDRLDSDLSSIKEFEDRYQKGNTSLTTEVSETRTKHTDLSERITLLGTRNKKLIDRYKEMKDKYSNLSIKLDANIENPPENKVLEFKQALDLLKVFFDPKKPKFQ